MNLADFLREMTQHRGDQSSLCRKLGVSNGTVSRWIMGDATRLTLENCLRIALEFNLDPMTVFRMAGRSDYADLYRKFLPDYHPQEITSADLYPSDHAPVHDVLQSLLESGAEAEIELVTGVLKLSEEKARGSHGPHHPLARKSRKTVHHS